VIVMLTAVWFLATGTGLVEYAHDAVHDQEDAELGAWYTPDFSHSNHPSPWHDDSNCEIHAQLHLPLITTPVVALLICAGLFIAFVSQLARVPVLTRLPVRIDCRGPPVLV
jgi:hypothetical protein